MAKNIKVKEILDNSIKVNFVHSPRMSECVDKLVELSDEDFRKVVRISKSYIKVNKLAMKFYEPETISVGFVKGHSCLALATELIALEKEGFVKAVRCAKKYRRANKFMTIAKINYQELEDADKATLSQKAAIYA